MEPLLKWAGGKRQILPELKKIITPELLDGHKYFEPFVGGGALVFALEHNNVVINDSNEELINVYDVVKNNPSELIKLLKLHKKKHNEDYYYSIRELDRNKRKYSRMSDEKKAARFIYLNRTCYNGLYRVNSSGHNNVPIGKQTSNNDIVMEDRITALSNYLNNNNVLIMKGDFENAVQEAQRGDVIYFDPPYDYEDSGFNSYVKEGFTHEDLIRLRDLSDQLIERGCVVVLSNNDTKFVRQSFSNTNYKIYEIDAKRYINCDGKNRTKAKEVIIYGHKNDTISTSR